jgi:hypothetical protein
VKIEKKLKKATPKKSSAAKPVSQSQTTATP